MSGDDYFDSYADLSVHRLMLSDSARTEAYEQAIKDNPDAFRDKVVMDVGAGTGILSLFCARAGARRVYAVEASSLSHCLAEVVRVNGMDEVVKVLASRVEDVKLDEQVDVIVSEWMGFYLLHESMLDCVLLARDRHLKPNGLLLPSHAKIFAAACSLTSFIQDKFQFWNNVYGFDMSPFRTLLLESQQSSDKPEIMTVGAEQLLTNPQEVCELDLLKIRSEDLDVLKKRSFTSVTRDGALNGIAIWFDVYFAPEHARLQSEVALRTGPESKETHWKQTVLIMPQERLDLELEEDDVIGWDLCLRRSDSCARHYVIEAQLLDPADDEHPIPCGCMSGKCLLLAALTQQRPDEEGCDLQHP